MGLRRVIVADTHAWLWWVSQKDLLSTAARNALDAGEAVAISAISLLEIATAEHRGRIVLDSPLRDWVNLAIGRTATIVLPVDVDIAIIAGQMIRQIGDPADRIIVATALRNDSKLVTRDGRIRKSGLVETTW